MPRSLGKPPLHLYDGHVRRVFDQSEQEVALRIKLAAPLRSLTARPVREFFGTLGAAKAVSFRFVLNAAWGCGMAQKLIFEISSTWRTRTAVGVFSVHERHRRPFPPSSTVGNVTAPTGLTGSPTVCYRPHRARVHLGKVG